MGREGYRVAFETGQHRRFGTDSSAEGLLKKAYYTMVFIAGALAVACSAIEKSSVLESIVEVVAFVSLAMNVAGVFFAAAWLRRSSVGDLRQAALITLTIPFARALIELLFGIQRNMHGVGMATLLFGGLLSLLAVAVLGIGAIVKHIRAVN